MADRITIELVMPDFGAGKKGAIKKWFKKAGDPVAAGDTIVTIANGKLVQSLNCEYEGVVTEVYPCAAGDEVEGGVILCKIDCDPNTKAEPKEEEKSSVIIIGGGPGGYVAAIRAASLGMEVKLVEKKKLGGTCLNVGCIPTKALLHSAELYHNAKNGEKYGVITNDIQLNWEQVLANRQSVSDNLTGGVAGLLALNGVEVIEGEASFESSSKILVKKADGTEETLEADNYIIATGSVPTMPPIPGIAGNPDCIDSTGALTLPELPKSMVIIGGGVISVELATAYAFFGTKVTVVEMLPRLLPPMDGELTNILQGSLEKDGIEFHLNAKVTSVEKLETGSAVHATLPDGSEIAIEGEKVLVAVGRRSYSEGLGLDKAGVETERGKILVNDSMETNVPGIYAIGDCNGKLMLAHTASAMGEVAAKNAAGKHVKFKPETTASCVYADPEFAGVGLTEEQAIASGKPYEVGRFPIAANGKALIEGCSDGMVKIISDAKTKKVIGVHILGPRATDLIAEAALGIGLNAGVRDFINTVHAHPTVAESVREAALAANGTPIHIH